MEVVKKEGFSAPVQSTTYVFQVHKNKLHFCFWKNKVPKWHDSFTEQQNVPANSEQFPWFPYTQLSQLQSPQLTHN